METKQEKQVYNPYLPLYEYVPDGEPHVFGDRLYLYGSHDRFDGEMFCLNDYVCYSADLHDLRDWRYEGIIFRKDQDPRNQKDGDPDEIPFIYDTKGRFQGGLNAPGIHALWAPDVVQGRDGRFYLYYCLDFLLEIGVAVCDTPAGKYEFLGFVRHADGTLLGQREGDLGQFDPGIFIDDDGEIYLYSGNAPMFREHIGGKQGSQVMTLEQDMLTLKKDPVKLLPDVSDSEGTGFEGHEFFEASSIRKIGGVYYLIYSSVLSRELCYATSRYPDRDYKFGGTLVDICDVGIGGRTAEHAHNCSGNTHGSIENVLGQWYVFYHRQTNRTQYSRQGCAERITIAEDGTIAQVPVTSCGLNGGPLRGEGTYPAAICCHLTGKDGIPFSDQIKMKWDYPFLTQDFADREPEMSDRKTKAGESKAEAVFTTTDPEKKSNAAEKAGNITQYIANFTDGCTAGYKFFDFKEECSVSVLLRGRAHGTLKIAVDDENCETVCGEIPVRIYTQEWTELSGVVRIPAGVHSVYFKYEGSGWMDFAAFGFPKKQ